MSLRKTFLLMLIFLTPSIIAIAPVSLAEVYPSNIFLDPARIVDSSLGPGASFAINMSLDDVEPDLLWAYQLTLEFNPAVLHGVSVENGPFLESRGGNALVVEGPGFDNDAGKLGLFAASLYPMERFPTGGSDEYGPLAIITFEVVGIGSSAITLGKETGIANRTAGWIVHKKETPEYFQDGYFDNRPSISITPAAVEDVLVGANFTVNLRASGMEDLYSWELSMNWSASLLNVTGVIEGGFLSDGTEFYQEIHNDMGFIYANCTRTGTSGVTGSGPLAAVTFLVTGSGHSSLHLSDTLLFDSVRTPIPHVTIDGSFTNQAVHDIAVMGVDVSPSMVELGSAEPVYINVTVKNHGDFIETFNVTVYYGDEEIGTERDISLDAGANATLMFTWDTEGVEQGSYKIKAVASVVAGEDSVTNNTFTYKSVVVRVRNISIVLATMTEYRVSAGDSVMIYLAVENKGSVTEDFNLTVYCNETTIETNAVRDLIQGEEVSVSIVWNITDVAPGMYLLTAEASAVPDESDSSDNVMKFGVVEVMGIPEGFSSGQVVAIVVIVAVAAVAGGAFVYRRIRPSEEEWG